MNKWLNDEAYDEIIECLRTAAKDLSCAPVSARDNVGVLNINIKHITAQSLLRAARDLEKFKKIRVDVTKKTKEYPRS